MTGELIDIGDGLATTKVYFTYSGSLTTPPCSEVVTWVVLNKPAGISQAQYEDFRHILGNNFRPLQAVNDRKIRSSRGGSQANR